MSQNRRQTAFLFSFLALLILIGLLFLRHRPNVITRQQQALHQVKRVIDGDTIVVKSIGKVRYIGINTPGIHHPTKGVEYSSIQRYCQSGSKKL